MKQYDPQKNAQALRAWDEWKEICWVAGCSAEAQDVLNREIYVAFKRLFQTRMPLNADEILRDESDWATEFDMGVINTPPPGLKKSAAPESEPDSAEITGLKKKYKDYLWALVQDSSDPSLQVIRGKLTSPVGIINGIADNYLKVHYPAQWENYQEFRNNTARKNKRDTPPVQEISLQAPVGEDGTSLEELVPGEDWQPGDEKPADLERKLTELFSPREIALIFAHMAKKTTAPETEAFLGCGHTTIANMWNNGQPGQLGLREKIRTHADFFQSQGVVFFMKKRLEAEKNAGPFLKLIEAQPKMKEFFAAMDERAVRLGLKS